MDVVLGVAVTGRVARLAMVGSPASGGQVLDQYALDLPDDAMTDLADTIVGTYRAVTDSGNRVAATRLCLPDASEAETLRQTVLSAGVENVDVVSEADAAAALARSVGADAALLLADDDTVSLAVVGEDEESTSVLASVPIGAAGVAVACAAVLQQAPGPEVHRIMLVGQRLDLESVAAELRSTTPVEVPADAGYAIARGAAHTAEESGFPAGASTMMAPAVADATQMAPAAADATQMAPATGDSAAVGPQLAYSQAEDPDFYEMPADSIEEFVPEQEDEEAYTAMIAPPPPKTLLMGSALGFVVVSFATLAVTVAVNVRPAADVQAQPAPAVQSDTVPGRYLPQVPHEPDPVALPVAVVSPPPAAPAVTRVPTNRGPVNNNAPAPQAPAPQAPPPGPAPAPQVPVVPVPPVVIFPPFNPFPTPTFPTPTFPTPTTTVTTTPTTTTTSTTPTTTTTPPTSTTTEPTTTPPSSEPSTIPVSPPSSIVTVAPVEPPPAQAPAYTPPPAYTPAPAYTPPAVAPEPAPAPAAPVAPEAPVVQVPVTTVPVSP
ncbi:hypothetical protein [Mycobacterium sp.]|uniref:hypothetical protein n=1 Tax=Mycobacterium sp. TaxID=1785 RepID=UPI002D9DAC21|nr:hypothetical protein [Mycobacterium sp.]